jgi:hypothetical protein
MAKIQRSDEINRIREGLMLDPSRENIPTSTTEKVQVVFDPQLRKVINKNFAAGASTSGTITLGTTPSDQDFFISAAYLSIAKNATADTGSTTLEMDCVINGARTTFLSIAFLDLTLLQSAIAKSFPIPIKPDRNTTIRIINGNFTAGTCIRIGGVEGYTEEIH